MPSLASLGLASEGSFGPPPPRHHSCPQRPSPIVRRTEIQGCAQCDHRVPVPRRDGLLRADPQHCAHCNP